MMLIQHTSLTLQGYNYDNGYIRANAKVYDDLEDVFHVLRYYHIGKEDIVMVAGNV